MGGLRTHCVLEEAFALSLEFGVPAKQFREVCGVTNKMKWTLPGEDRIRPDTNEIYYTPDFREDVSHPVNAAIIQKVALCLMEDLKVDIMSNHGVL